MMKKRNSSITPSIQIKWCYVDKSNILSIKLRTRKKKLLPLRNVIINYAEQKHPRQQHSLIMPEVNSLEPPWEQPRQYR